MSEQEELDEGALIPQPSLALGFLACAPLFALYELGLLAAGPEPPRNAAELLVGRGLVVFGAWERVVRWALLLAATCAALWFLRERGRELARDLARQLGEGFAAALALGPTLFLLMTFFDVSVSGAMPSASVVDPPTLGRAVRLVGAAAWEELFFRVGLYSVVFLFVVQVARFFGAARAAAALVGDLCALILSAVGFAAFHLTLFQRWLGIGGEVHDPSVFLWRLLAGVLLAALYRWRGLGVSAWAHGLFNLGLALGAVPS